jgi:SPP1 family predicted phage head-tail adaptor
MLAGRLRHSITIKRNARVDDGAGGATTAEVVVCDCRASREPLSASERYAAGRMDAKVTERWLMRYTPIVRQGDWFNYDGQRFRIVGVRDLKGRSKTLELTAEQDD